MRDQHFTPEQFVAAARIFGELLPHDKKERHVPGHPERGLHLQRRDRERQAHYSGRDVPHRPFQPSTAAQGHHAVRGRTAIQRRRHAIRQYACAYDDLPADTKRKIDGLKAVHVYHSKYSPRPLGKITDESRRNLPPPGIHPLVRTHPENGRKALYLNPVRIESIVGMEDKDALALIEDLMRHATQKKYEYRHKWRHGDWVLWDNRSLMHQANPDYDMNERRYLYRLMLQGEAPV